MAHPESTGSNDARHVQLQQAIETLRFQAGLLVQFYGFLIAVDALLVGYAISQKQAAFYLLAVSAPMLTMMASWVILVHAIPVAYVAIQLERRLLPDEDTVTVTWVRSRFPAVYRQITAALEAADAYERDRLVRRRVTLRDISNRIVLLVLADIAAHVVLFVVAVAVFHHKVM